MTGAPTLIDDVVIITGSAQAWRQSVASLPPQLTDAHVGEIWDGIAKQAKTSDDLATPDHPPPPTLTAVY